MATSLTGLTPATTYDSLLKLGDNNNLTSTSKVVSDGLGNDTLINLSTTAFRLVAPANVAGTNGFYFDGSTNRVSIGINSATASLHVRGSDALAASTALLVQNSTPTDLFTISNSGVIRINGSNTQSSFNIKGLGNTTSSSAFSVYDSSNNENFRVVNGTAADSLAYFRSGLAFFGSSNIIRLESGFATTAGQANYLSFAGGTLSNPTDSEVWNTDFSRGFTANAGTTVYNNIILRGTINQTGTATGISRGIYVNPTITSAANWRSIETTNNTGYAAYFGGTADLFLNNGVDIQIGTGTGTKIGTAATQKIGFYNATPVEQPTSGVATSITFTANTGTAVNDASTFGGYTILKVVQALKNLGLLA